MYVEKPNRSLASVSEVVKKVIVFWRAGRRDDHSVLSFSSIKQGKNNKHTNKQRSIRYNRIKPLQAVKG